jgi:hypothetical protein
MSHQSNRPVLDTTHFTVLDHLHVGSSFPVIRRATRLPREALQAVLRDLRAFLDGHRGVIERVCEKGEPGQSEIASKAKASVVIMLQCLDRAEQGLPTAGRRMENSKSCR